MPDPAAMRRFPEDGPLVPFAGIPCGEIRAAEIAPGTIPGSQLAASHVWVGRITLYAASDRRPNKRRLRKLLLRQGKPRRHAYDPYGCWRPRAGGLL